MTQENKSGMSWMVSGAWQKGWRLPKRTGARIGRVQHRLGAVEAGGGGGGRTVLAGGGIQAQGCPALWDRPQADAGMTVCGTRGMCSVLLFARAFGTYCPKRLPTGHPFKCPPKQASEQPKCAASPPISPSAKTTCKTGNTKHSACATCATSHIGTWVCPNGQIIAEKAAQIVHVHFAQGSPFGRKQTTSAQQLLEGRSHGGTVERNDGGGPVLSDTLVLVTQRQRSAFA